jgi:hypothetical protein
MNECTKFVFLNSPLPIPPSTSIHDSVISDQQPIVQPTTSPIQSPAAATPLARESQNSSETLTANQKEKYRCNTM